MRKLGKEVADRTQRYYHYQCQTIRSKNRHVAYSDRRCDYTGYKRKRNYVISRFKRKMVARILSLAVLISKIRQQYKNTRRYNKNNDSVYAVHIEQIRKHRYKRSS